MMKRYTYQDQVFSFEGCISIQETPEWVMPWRIDYQYLEFYPGVAEVAHQCAGVSLVFSTTSIDLELELVEPAKEMKVDLFVDGLFIQEARVDFQNRLVFDPLPPGNKLIEILLDQRYPVKLKSVSVDDQAVIKIEPVQKRRWVHYGCSISQSKEARSPANTWTALVAHKLNLNLTNLAYDDQCKVEPMVARIIRDLPADFITLKLGTNIYIGDMTGRTFAANVIGMIQIIREKHPETPMIIISPLFSAERETKTGNSGLNFQEIRFALEDIVAVCQKYGDQHLYYVDGLHLFGPAEEFYLHDGLHPDAEGQLVLAKSFIKEVFKKHHFLKK